MYLNRKGKVPKQAHVGIPEGVCEEEHGRNGFAGPVSHLYRTHPPTGWVKIEGPLKPRAFACFPDSATTGCGTKHDDLPENHHASGIQTRLPRGSRSAMTPPHYRCPDA